MAWNGSDGGAGGAGGASRTPLHPAESLLRGWWAWVIGAAGLVGVICLGISALSRGGQDVGDGEGEGETNKKRIGLHSPANAASDHATRAADDGETGDGGDVGVALAPPPPPKKDWQQLQREAMARKLGRKKEHQVVHNDSNATDGNGRKPIHRNSTEHIMSMVFTTGLGDMPPPLPEIPDRDRKRLAEILLDKFEIEQDDPDAEEKQIINEVKDALAEHIREGGDVDEFFSAYHRQLELAHRERTESRKMVLETAREGDAELAKDLLDRFNENLESKGVKPINLPHWIIEKKASVK